MQPRIRDDAGDSSSNNNLDQNRPNDTTIVCPPRSEVKGLSGSKKKDALRKWRKTKTPCT